MNDIEFDVTTINFAWPGFSAHDATNILVRYAMQLSLQYVYVPNSGRYMHINFDSRMPSGSIAVRQDRQMDGVSYGYDIKEFERSKTPREDWIDLIAEVLIQFADSDERSIESVEYARAAQKSHGADTKIFRTNLRFQHKEYNISPYVKWDPIGLPRSAANPLLYVLVEDTKRNRFGERLLMESSLSEILTLTAKFRVVKSAIVAKYIPSDVCNNYCRRGFRIPVQTTFEEVFQTLVDAPPAIKIESKPTHEQKKTAVSKTTKSLNFAPTLSAGTAGQLTDEKFWKLVALIDQDFPDDQLTMECMSPLVEALSKLELSEIKSFEDHLTDCLYSLDTREHARACKLQGRSSDAFLYARAYVVARGRKTFLATLNKPSRMPKEWEDGECLLTAAQKAWSIKTIDAWEYVTQKSYETGSNREGWRRPLDAPGGNDSKAKK